MRDAPISARTVHPCSAAIPLRRPRAKVLVVEDHDDTRETLALFLQTEGYDVVLAADGEAGIEAARTSEPNVAIVDIFLPRKDGVAVIEELSRDLPDVKIIAVSADGSQDRLSALIRAREAGAHQTLRKPLEPWVLLADAGRRRVRRGLASLAVARLTRPVVRTLERIGVRRRRRVVPHDELVTLELLLQSRIERAAIVLGVAHQNPAAACTSGTPRRRRGRSRGRRPFR